jgi:hypothetical protein
MRNFSAFLDLVYMGRQTDRQRQTDMGGAYLHFMTLFPICHLDLSCHLRLCKSNAVDEMLLNKLRN